jgi:hypothetical protein
VLAGRIEDGLVVRAIGRTNDGMLARRASAALVHRIVTGSAARSGVDVIDANGQLPEEPAASPPVSGPMRTPSDCTTCVSYALVSIAIS